MLNKLKGLLKSTSLVMTLLFTLNVNSMAALIDDSVIFTHSQGHAMAWEIGSDFNIKTSKWIGSFGSSDWKLISKEDMNWDGIGDLTFQSPSGQIVVVTMNGLKKTGVTSPMYAGSGWTLIGMENLDGTGSKEFITQSDSSGDIRILKMGANFSFKGYLTLSKPGSKWKAVGIKDIDGNGKKDVILQNKSNGNLKALSLKSNYTSELKWIGSPGSADWKAVAVKDLDNDGIPDILLQHLTNSYVKALKLSNDFSSTQKWIGNPGGESWKITTIEDLDGDNIVDIVLQHGALGYLTVFRMETDFIANYEWLANPGGASWKVIRAQDIDGDGMKDIIMSHSTLPYVKALKLNYFFKVGSRKWIGSPGSVSWTPEGSKVNHYSQALFEAVDKVNITEGDTEDIFVVDLKVGAYYLEAALKVGTTADSNDLRIHILDSGDNIIYNYDDSSIDNSGDTGSFDFVVPSNGKYKIKVYTDYNKKASYSFKLYPSLANGLIHDANGEMNDRDFMATPTTIAKTQNGITGNLNNVRKTDTYDFYSLDLKAGEYYLTSEILAGSVSANYSDLLVDIYDPNGASVGIVNNDSSFDSVGNLMTKNFTAPIAGTYIVRFYRQSTLATNYTFSLETAK